MRRTVYHVNMPTKTEFTMLRFRLTFQRDQQLVHHELVIEVVNCVAGYYRGRQPGGRNPRAVVIPDELKVDVDATSPEEWACAN